MGRELSYGIIVLYNNNNKCRIKFFIDIYFI